MLLHLLTLLASLSWGQSTNTVTASTIDTIKLNNISVALRDLQSGNPRLTGKPVFGQGVSFSDGSTLTGDPKISTNTWSGQNTFRTDKFTLSGGIFGSWWVPVASETLNYVSTVTFSGLSSSETYRLEFQLRNNTAATDGMVYVAYNTIEALPIYHANYIYDGNSIDFANDKFLGIGRADVAQFQNKQAVTGTIEFGTLYQTSTTVITTGRTTFNYTDSQILQNDIGAKVPLLSQLSSINIFAAAVNHGASFPPKTISGKFRLYKRVD